MRKFTLAAALSLLTISTGAANAQLSGEIKVDGSSTTYLITEAVAAKFKQNHPGVKISVGISGTGGGFKKFANGETDISNASRKIRPQEAEACKAKGIDFLELQVAWDGLAVIIHPENTWARNMTVEQLHLIWKPGSTVKKWSDVDSSWPNEEIKLFGAGTDSGTFDYFTEAINGKEKACRPDYTASEDDNVTIRGVAGSKYALGFLGLAYAEHNAKIVSTVNIADRGSKKFVPPTSKTVLSGDYKPLSRPLFIYIKTSSLSKPEVREFARFYLRRNDLVREAKYVEMDSLMQLDMQEKLEEALKKIK